MTFKVQSKICATCIYRADLAWDLTALLKAIEDPAMRGFFKSFRICHHSDHGVCCRGFWNAHKDDFNAGQIAQRLGMVEFVEEDSYGGVEPL